MAKTGEEPQETETGARLSAADLRTRMAEHVSQEEAKAATARDAAAVAEKALVERFMNDALSEGEIEKFRTRVHVAVERGDLEVLLGTFPAKLCSDGGRAINSFDPDWPSSLQGKARQVYDIWRTQLRDQGYRLYARIESFPGGMPGDVGVYLSWKE